MKKNKTYHKNSKLNKRNTHFNKAMRSHTRTNFLLVHLEKWMRKCSTQWRIKF